MLDNFGRKISYLRLSVTDKCNYRCVYCMPDVNNKLLYNDICSFEELYNMASAAVECGVTKIRITGGEPLIRTGIIDFCKKISGINGLKELCITTNGSLLPLYADKLYDAGVSRINISIDTLKSDRFKKITGTGCLSDVLNGIEAAEKLGFKKIKLNCVLIKGFNDDEIIDFVNLTRDHPWDVRFIELMPIGACKNWQGSRFMSVYDVLKICPELSPTKSDGVALCYKLENSEGTVGLIAPISHIFCSECSRIRITCDGKLKPCLHSTNEVNLRGLSGDELKTAVNLGIALKPEKHFINTTGLTETNRSMNQIGG